MPELGRVKFHDDQEETTMIDYAKILAENPNGVLATQDGEKVKTRI